MTRTVPERREDDSPFYEIIGDPLLLTEFELRAYLKLRRAVEAAYAPEGLFDYWDVMEIVTRMIEVQRFKGAQIAVISSPTVLADLLKIVFGDNIDKAMQVAVNYFSVDEKKARQAAILLLKEGITAPQIHGHAISSQTQKLQVLDQLVNSRQAAIKRTGKQLAKRARQRLANNDRILGPETSNSDQSDGDTKQGRGQKRPVSIQ